MKIKANLFVVLAAQLIHLVVSDSKCQDDCYDAYSHSKSLVRLCKRACTDGVQGITEGFDAEYPYWLGPLDFIPHLGFSQTGDDILGYEGELWSRVDYTRTKIQFLYKMNRECDEADPYCPHFAMHLHLGNLEPGAPGGPIVVSIAGTGDIVVCVAVQPDSPWPFGGVTICSESCTDSDEAAQNCIRPENTMRGQCDVCNVVAGGAYFCPGGCAGDGRIVGNAILDAAGNPTGEYETVVPSRFCGIEDGETSNAPQGTWIQGKYSNEYSGNPEDPDYSPNSIGVLENFDQLCAKSVPWLVEEVFAEGKESYVALHTDFNATGYASLVFGDIFAMVSTADGGAENCYIFGDREYPCNQGYPGGLPGLADEFDEEPEDPPSNGKKGGKKDDDEDGMGKKGYGRRRRFRTRG